jgi:glycosyltransferase involved in cell wall biosynthesis
MAQGMRIAWATPFNEYSAIARYSLQVVQELRKRGMDVKLVRTETGESALLPLLANGVSESLGDRESIRANFDLVVVTLADHWSFNKGSFDLLKMLPCIGIFHDSDLEHLSATAVNPLILDHLRRTYTSTCNDLVPTGPDLTWMANLCVGAVVHSPHYCESVRTGCPGPTLIVPLCFERPPVCSVRMREKEFTIVTFGYLNSNKQIDRVMRAISQSAKLKDRFHYRLFGLVSDVERGRLLDLASKLNIKAPHFEGWVSDVCLQKALSDANVICCLRNPILEGGSASLIFSLYSSTPVIVANAGSYAQVPDDLVFKVSYGSETDDLTDALETIAVNQEDADLQAVRAAEWAAATYSVTAYVDHLLPFFEECVGMLPVVEAGRALGATLQDIGASLDEPSAGRIGALMQQLFIKGAEGMEL